MKILNNYNLILTLVITIFSFLLLLFHVKDYGNVGKNCDAEKLGRIGIKMVIEEIPEIGSFVNELPDVFWPDNCIFDKIGKMIQAAIDAEESEMLRRKLKGFNSALDVIRNENATYNLDRMGAYYLDLEEATYDFAETKVDTAIIYFREFATIKILVMKIRLELEPNNEGLKRIIKKSLEELVYFGEKMIKVVPKDMFQKGSFHVPELWQTAVFRVKIKVSK